MSVIGSSIANVQQHIMDFTQQLFNAPHRNLLGAGNLTDAEMGRSMEHYIKTGQLAPDELVVGIIADYMESHREG